MPAAFAHYAFGCQCLDVMPASVRKSCLKYRDLYDLGVHGPDILFYYDFLKSNRVNRFGEAMHHIPGRDFFRKCRRVFQENPGNEAATAYIFGFLAHFALDAACHPYVNQKDAEGPFSHNAIEAAFESRLIAGQTAENTLPDFSGPRQHSSKGHANAASRFILRTKKAGPKPAAFDRRRLLHPSHFAARTIASFFPFSREVIFKALKGQVSAMGLLYSPAGIKKNILKFLIRRLPVSDSLGDLFPDNKPLPALCEAAEALENLMKKALSDYTSLSPSLLSYLEGQRETLPAAFDADFEGILHSSSL